MRCSFTDEEKQRLRWDSVKVRSLDKFYKYLQNHEAGDIHGEAQAAEAAEQKRIGAKTTAPGPRSESRYVIRNGVTVAVAREMEVSKPHVTASQDTPAPLEEDDTAPTASLTPSVTDNDQADGAVWRGLPENVRRLAQLSADLLPDATPQSPERRQLIERLLNPLLSLEDTARLLGVCTATVRRYANKGALAHQRTIGQQRRFLLSDVLALLESRKPTPDLPSHSSEEMR
jgi:excisionase family DNA binding protein